MTNFFYSFLIFYIIFLKNKWLIYTIKIYINQIFLEFIFWILFNWDDFRRTEKEEKEIGAKVWQGGKKRWILMGSMCVFLHLPKSCLFNLERFVEINRRGGVFEKIIKLSLPLTMHLNIAAVLPLFFFFFESRGVFLRKQNGGFHLK